MKKIIKKATVTIALSAYNEEKNIIPFLKSVIKQKDEDFRITQILIFSDGSTDNTVERALRIKDSRIKIFNYKSRKGKSLHLNTIYRNLTTDYLVQTDGDVVFSHPYVVRDMIKPLIENKNIGMCTGNPLPLPGKTFTGKADSEILRTIWPILKQAKGGNNVFSADGRILSYRKELVEKITVPYDMIANDVFTYFCCIHIGYKSKYVKTATVLFNAPQTIQDKIRQNLRSATVLIRMEKYFPKKLVEEELSIPLSVRIKSILTQFIKHPVYSVYIFGIHQYCLLKSQSAEKWLNAKWPIATTTKDLEN